MSATALAGTTSSSANPAEGPTGGIGIPAGSGARTPLPTGERRPPDRRIRSGRSRLTRFPTRFRGADRPPWRRSEAGETGSRAKPAAGRGRGRRYRRARVVSSPLRRDFRGRRPAFAGDRREGPAGALPGPKGQEPGSRAGRIAARRRIGNLPVPRAEGTPLIRRGPRGPPARRGRGTHPATQRAGSGRTPRRGPPAAGPSRRRRPQRPKRQEAESRRLRPGWGTTAGNTA